MTEASDVLPIFPLNTVLMPGIALPLHIFEERYKEMVTSCLASSALFGVVLIASGHEVGAPARPYPVGTLARIAGVDRLPDGRMNILCVGEQRFRIVEAIVGKSYQQARVEMWPDEDEECEVANLVVQLRSSLAEFITAGKSDPAEALDRLPSKPRELSFIVASSLPIDLAERQSLLEEPSLCSRLRRISDLLRVETKMMRAMSGSRYIAERPSRFSDN